MWNPKRAASYSIHPQSLLLSRVFTPSLPLLLYLKFIYIKGRVRHLLLTINGELEENGARGDDTLKEHSI